MVTLAGFRYNCEEMVKWFALVRNYNVLEMENWSLEQVWNVGGFHENKHAYLTVFVSHAAPTLSLT